jgi:predicted phosphohydrolase
MSLYAIGDIHLSLGTDKPMDVFGSNWGGYVQKLEKNWCHIVQEEDTVLIPGDISWATYIEDAIQDFSFINSLPGRKIISKGNHDYWWTTASKMNKFIKENNFENIFFLHNNFYTYEDWAICGTRGWFAAEQDASEEDKKIFKREIARLELSISEAVKSGADRILAALHYPPNEEFINTLRKYNVEICLYGHIHSDFSNIQQGKKDGIEIKCVSSDYLNFMPIKII